jgi:hypothetical protein
MASTGPARFPAWSSGHHQFVGHWFEHYDPKLHDAIVGPVEEFRTNRREVADAFKHGLNITLKASVALGLLAAQREVY